MATATRSSRLSFARIARDQLLRHARAGYPHEACGLLLGRREAGRATVRFASQGRNLRTDRARDRYELDPAHLLRLEQIADETGLEVLGVWHSHPDHPARPSATDREHAWPGWSYVIVSIERGEVADLRSWRLEEDPSNPGEPAFQEEAIEA